MQTDMLHMISDN